MLSRALHLCVYRTRVTVQDYNLMFCVSCLRKLHLRDVSVLRHGTLKRDVGELGGNRVVYCKSSHITGRHDASHHTPHCKVSEKWFLFFKDLLLYYWEHTQKRHMWVAGFVCACKAAIYTHALWVIGFMYIMHRCFMFMHAHKGRQYALTGTQGHRLLAC